MKRYIFIFFLFFSAAVVNGAEITFQDNTHANTLRCCNSTACADFDDKTITQNGTQYFFGIQKISNISSCWEAGDRTNISISNWVLTFPKKIILVISGVLFIAAVIYTFRKIQK